MNDQEQILKDSLRKIGVKSDDEIVGPSAEFHRRIHVRARNLLMEYRLAPPPHRGCVPHDIVEMMMRLYGYLIVKLIVDEQRRNETLT